MINLFQPSVGTEELEAIREVFDSNWLGEGRRVEEFRANLAQYLGCGSKELQPLSSCTEGLFQTMYALGLGTGDQVVMPSISFVGTAQAVRSVGAEVVLCDVNPRTLNPTVDHVAAAVTSRTRCIVILHFGGAPGEASEIARFARQAGIPLVEDAACSLGSFVGESACGMLGDVGVWSFDAMKIITTGDGGMVWSRHPAISERIRLGVTMGVRASGFQRRAQSHNWWQVDPEVHGRRAIMNDISAAIGSAQLRRLPSFLLRRKEIAQTYDVALASLDWMMTPSPQASASSRTFYWVQTEGTVRDRLARYLLDQGIYTSFRYWPLHRTEMFHDDRQLSGANLASSSTLLLPLHQGLRTSDVEHIVSALHNFVP